MKKLALAIGLLAFIGGTAVAQDGPRKKNEQKAELNEFGHPKPGKMSPQMTEFWDPQPAVVTAGQYKATVEMPVLDVKKIKKGVVETTPVESSAIDSYITAPSDAIVLFDGTNLDEWESADGSPAKWAVADGCFTVVPKTGIIRTKRKFNDFQLHIEWREPEDIQGKSQGRGNSGVFLQGQYEVQVLDSYNNETYKEGGAGSIYKQSAPLVNAMREPGKWNVYDIIYTAPTFKADGTYRTHPYVTVLHNGVLIQNHTMILGTTEYIGLPKVQAHGAGPIELQDHGNPVSFRNVWIREL